jgi:hypothetical protein
MNLDSNPGPPTICCEYQRKPTISEVFSPSADGALHHEVHQSVHQDGRLTLISQ